MRTAIARIAAIVRRELGTSSERRLAAVALGGIALGGAVVGLATFALPHPPGTRYAEPAIALGVAIVIGIGLLRYRDRVGWTPIALAVAAGAAIVTVAMLAVPDRTGAYAGYYVWLGVFSFYFLRPAVALAQIGWIASLYAVAVAMDSPPGAVEQWVNGVATTLGVGLLVLTLRTRIRALVERLERTARTDQLTGLPNRRGFDEQLGREVERSIRSGEPLSLALLDLDGFKRVNDGSGHQAGDAVLRDTAALIEGTVRATDWPARIGGDEFAVILAGIDEAGAIEVCERLRVALAAGFGAAPGRESLGVSIGVAATDHDGLDVDGLLGAADRALYTAKSLGGTRVTGSSVGAEHLRDDRLSFGQSR